MSARPFPSRSTKCSHVPAAWPAYALSGGACCRHWNAEPRNSPGLPCFSLYLLSARPVSTLPPRKSAFRGRGMRKPLHVPSLSFGLPDIAIARELLDPDKIGFSIPVDVCPLKVCAVVAVRELNLPNIFKVAAIILDEAGGSSVRRHAQIIGSTVSGQICKSDGSCETSTVSQFPYRSQSFAHYHEGPGHSCARI